MCTRDTTLWGLFIGFGGVAAGLRKSGAERVGGGGGDGVRESWGDGVVLVM